MQMIKYHLANAKAFLQEATPTDSLKYQQEMAIKAKRCLERGKLRIDTLIEANPGLTERCEDLKRLKALYDNYNEQVKILLSMPSSIVSSTRLLKALADAERDVMGALERKRSPQRALNSLAAVESIQQAIERRGEKVPETLLDRLNTLRGYSIEL